MSRFASTRDVDAKTHPYISTGLKDNKFGIAFADAEPVYVKAAELKHIEVIGMDCHIGSQLTEMSPYIDAFDRLLELIGRLRARGIDIHHLDLGGGLGIRYRDEAPPQPAGMGRSAAQPATGFYRHHCDRAGPGHRRQRRYPGEPG